MFFCYIETICLLIMCFRGFDYSLFRFEWSDCVFVVIVVGSWIGGQIVCLTVRCSSSLVLTGRWDNLDIRRYGDHTVSELCRMNWHVCLFVWTSQVAFHEIPSCVGWDNLCGYAQTRQSLAFLLSKFSFFYSLTSTNLLSDSCSFIFRFSVNGPNGFSTKVRTPCCMF